MVAQYVLMYSDDSIPCSLRMYVPTINYYLLQALELVSCDCKVSRSYSTTSTIDSIMVVLATTIIERYRIRDRFRGSATWQTALHISQFVRSRFVDNVKI
jgi:hypothetical protein